MGTIGPTPGGQRGQWDGSGAVNGAVVGAMGCRKGAVDDTRDEGDTPISFRDRYHTVKGSRDGRNIPE